MLSQQEPDIQSVEIVQKKEQEREYMEDVDPTRFNTERMEKPLNIQEFMGKLDVVKNKLLDDPKEWNKYKMHLKNVKSSKL